MRKILVPVISLVCVILVAIAFGISAQTVATRVGINFANYYQLVFERGSNVFALVSFILLVVGSVLLIVCLIPFKFRKFVLPVCSASFIVSGIFVLLAPGKVQDALPVKANGTLIATAVLLIVAGALVCCLTLLAFLGKKESK